MSELIKAFILIFIAEMGDKTQIIAMTFATQYKVKEVLAGVFWGVLLNHGLAIVLGNYLSKLIPLDYVQIVAGLLFVFFGIMSLRDEDLNHGEQRQSFSPVFTVALAFFVGELGDKTQLTAMALGAEGNYPFLILMGTTLGMIATSGIGILIGSKIGERIPDTYLKISASLVFVFCGTLKLYNWLPPKFLKLNYIVVYFALIFIIEIVLIRRLIYIRKHIKTSPMKEVAASLYIQTQILKDTIEDICLEEKECGACLGNKCIIGYIKSILENARDNEEYYVGKTMDLDKMLKKNFHEDKVIKALGLIIEDYIKYGVVEDENFIINEIRRSLEIILFGENIKFDQDLSQYIKNIQKIKKDIGNKLKDGINLGNNV